MADYYDALASAVANLESVEQPARYAFYDRARRLVLERLQAIEPPMPDAAIRGEMDAFNAAIRRVENDILKPAKSALAQATEQLDIPPDYVAQEASEAVPGLPIGNGNSRQRNIIIACTALVLAASLGGYAFWGHRPPPIPARPSVVAAPSIPISRIREPERPASDAENLPYILRRQLVYYRSTHPPGTVVIAKSQNFLYVVRPNSTAMRYTIGMGPDCINAMGLYQISRKDGVSDGILPAGTQDKPTGRLDTRLLYLSDSNYRIRQTTSSIAIGRNLPSPGFQLVIEDFADLFANTEIGTRVIVTN